VARLTPSMKTERMFYYYAGHPAVPPEIYLLIRETQKDINS